MAQRISFGEFKVWDKVLFECYSFLRLRGQSSTRPTFSPKLANHDWWIMEKDQNRAKQVHYTNLSVPLDTTPAFTCAQISLHVSRLAISWQCSCEHTIDLCIEQLLNVNMPLSLPLHHLRGDPDCDEDSDPDFAEMLSHTSMAARTLKPLNFLPITDDLKSAA